MKRIGTSRVDVMGLGARFAWRRFAAASVAALLAGCAGMGTSVGVSVPIGKHGGVGVSVGSGGTISGTVGVGVGGGSVSVGTSGRLPQGSTEAEKKEEKKSP